MIAISLPVYMKQLALICLLLTSFVGAAQDISSNYRTKKVAVADTIQIDTVSINSSKFILLDKTGRVIDSTKYQVDFVKSRLILKDPTSLENDSLTVEYLRYPDYLTRRYSLLDEDLILDNQRDLDRIYSLTPERRRNFLPFDGLSTSGSISRGVTIGNNQNAVLNSQLDLQIAGKISDKVSLRASIQDANIPLQESGYSQRLDEFDQVFIELSSDNWNVRAGDVNLTNQDSYFMRFTKKVQGVSIGATLNHKNSKTHLFGAGALVRGRFTQSQFQGQEGNQGPYKLLGPNQELFILIISGSERVFVNGRPLERGENKDYVIDYNAGELLFNATYPITSDMRITVEYQFTDNNYTRFVAYGGVQHQSETFRIGGYVYSENDAKNQPVQQNLSQEQVQTLSDAGDNMDLMTAPSAVADTFSENKILYRREVTADGEIFVFSTNPDDDLFNVRFSFVGANQGNYVLSSDVAIGRIFEFVPPIGGIPQGDYEPIIRLVAPTKIQMAIVNGAYTPSEKTNINFELGVSSNDLNLFSDIDDDDNQGFAGRLVLDQRIIDKEWKANVFGNLDIVDENFRNIEGLYQVEFNRDWNLPTAQTTVGQSLNGNLGDQQLVSSGIRFSHPEKGSAQYAFEYLDFKNTVTGNRHLLNANLSLNKLNIFIDGSRLTNETPTTESDFTRLHARAIYGFKKSWVGTGYDLEDNQQRETIADTLTPISQRYNAYHVFAGVGDSTKIYLEAGYKLRKNDSIRNNNLERFNTSNTYYAKSRLLQNKNSQLSVFVSYRDFNNEDENVEDEQSLNSRILYNQKLFNQIATLNTLYETNSGTVAQQEFTYVKVEPGQGTFTWNDYNNNGIQELNEFEVAPFPDQAEFIRVLLPNQIFVKTHQNKFSQTLILNPTQWSEKTGFKKFLSHFYNQTSYLIDRKVIRDGNNFNLNPFKEVNDGLLGLTQNIRNTLFYNRGKQRYTTSYTFLDTRTRNQLSIGGQESGIKSHQLQFTHKLNDFWLVTLTGITSTSESFSENFASRNFEVDAFKLNPKLSYLFSKNSRFDVFYEFQNKENQLGNLESLEQQKIGVSFSYANQQKIAITGAFNYLNNQFEGNAFSPVGYQLLEGLQPGDNFTWNLLAQKQLTKFLDLNLNYQGRKSENARTIHTGSVQLKAFF